MVPEAPYVGDSRRKKCSHRVDGDDSGDVASLPLAWGSAQYDIPSNRRRFQHDINSAHTVPPHAQFTEPARPDVCRVKVRPLPNRRVANPEDE